MFQLFAAVIGTLRSSFRTGAALDYAIFCTIAIPFAIASFFTFERFEGSQITLAESLRGATVRVHAAPSLMAGHISAPLLRAGLPVCVSPPRFDLLYRAAFPEKAAL
jgi:hypothetical protein